MKDAMFWEKVRELAVADVRPDVPNNVVKAAVDIFQPMARVNQNPFRVFNLVPQLGGAVRRAEPSLKFNFELDHSYFVQLEQSWDPEGITLSGSVDGLNDPLIFLFKREGFYETDASNGIFEFEGLVPGCYTMCFSCKEDSYWIRKLALEPQD